MNIMFQFNDYIWVTDIFRSSRPFSKIKLIQNLPLVYMCHVNKHLKTYIQLVLFHITFYNICFEFIYMHRKNNIINLNLIDSIQ